VDLYGIKARTPRGSDAGQYVSEARWNTRYPGEAVRIHSIHAHRDPSQASIFERPCRFCEKMSICGDDNI